MKSAQPILYPALLGFALLCLWEVLARATDVDPLLLPTPSSIAAFISQNAGLLANHTFATSLIIFSGILLGTILGICIGVLLHRSQWFNWATYPWLVASQMIPIPAIAPVLLLWMGFTVWPKLVVVALISFFPVAVNTFDGLRRIDAEAFNLLRTFKATPWQQLRIVGLPSALPSIFSGIRVASALAVVAAIFGEWVGSRSGLGQLMLIYNNQAKTEGVFATVFLLALVGIALFGALSLVERYWMPWRRS